VTQWGVVLLCAYIVLGVSRFSRQVAGRLALVVTVLVVGGATVSYMTTGPAVPTANLGGTPLGSAPATGSDPQNTEDTAGRSQELNNDPAAAQAQAQLDRPATSTTSSGS
jgi:hypothetical protein